MSENTEKAPKEQERTRNVSSKNATDYDRYMKPLNSKFNHKRKTTTLMYNTNERQEKTSILYSAVRNHPTNNLISSTFEGNGSVILTHPEIPKCEIKMQKKEIKKEDSHCPSSVAPDHNEKQPNVESSAYKQKPVKKTRRVKSSHFRKNTKITRKPSFVYKGSKIKTTKSFQLRMEERTAHKNLFHSNIRPKSAGLMWRMKRHNHNKSVDNKCSSKASKYKNLITNNTRKNRLLSSAHPNNRVSEMGKLNLNKTEVLDRSESTNYQYTMTQNIIIDQKKIQTEYINVNPSSKSSIKRALNQSDFLERRASQKEVHNLSNAMIPENSSSQLQEQCQVLAENLSRYDRKNSVKIFNETRMSIFRANSQKISSFSSDHLSPSKDGDIKMERRNLNSSQCDLLHKKVDLETEFMSSKNSKGVSPLHKVGDYSMNQDIPTDLKAIMCYQRRQKQNRSQIIPKGILWKNNHRSSKGLPKKVSHENGVQIKTKSFEFKKIKKRANKILVMKGEIPKPVEKPIFIVGRKRQITNQRQKIIESQALIYKRLMQQNCHQVHRHNNSAVLPIENSLEFRNTTSNVNLGSRKISSSSTQCRKKIKSACRIKRMAKSSTRLSQSKNVGMNDASYLDLNISRVNCSSNLRRAKKPLHLLSNDLNLHQNVEAAEPKRIQNVPAGNSQIDEQRNGLKIDENSYNLFDQDYKNYKRGSIVTTAYEPEEMKEYNYPETETGKTINISCPMFITTKRVETLVRRKRVKRCKKKFIKSNKGRNSEIDKNRPISSLSPIQFKKSIERVRLSQAKKSLPQKIEVVGCAAASEGFCDSSNPNLRSKTPDATEPMQEKCLRRKILSSGFHKNTGSSADRNQLLSDEVRKDTLSDVDIDLAKPHDIIKVDDIESKSDINMINDIPKQEYKVRIKSKFTKKLPQTLSPKIRRCKATSREILEEFAHSFQSGEKLIHGSKIIKSIPSENKKRNIFKQLSNSDSGIKSSSLKSFNQMNLVSKYSKRGSSAMFQRRKTAKNVAEKIIDKKEIIPRVASKASIKQLNIDLLKAEKRSKFREHCSSTMVHEGTSFMSGTSVNDPSIIKNQIELRDSTLNQSLQSNTYGKIHVSHRLKENEAVQDSDAKASKNYIEYNKQLVAKMGRKDQVIVVKNNTDSQESQSKRISMIRFCVKEDINQLKCEPSEKLKIRSSKIVWNRLERLRLPLNTSTHLLQHIQNSRPQKSSLALHHQK
ncbi:unnamed protein product [Moneuplotes crassus]|uniref:Uncharacterized protein n=1 Tax=Euplotes crassus TaxID=5936 RepID=A0AAD1UB55_EUPCR|nr:unnamed protein product [Moneuplotes crassus]